MTFPTVTTSGAARPSRGAPLVLHVFPTFAVGGAQVRFAAVANRWGDRFRHAIVSLDGRTECAARLAVPHTVLAAPDTKARNFPQRLLSIRAALRRVGPDVLVTSNWGAIEWAIANLAPPRVRHVHTEDGFGPDEASGQKPRRMLARRLSLRRSTVVLPSGVLLRSAREAWLLPERGLRFVPNGVALSRFRPDGPPAALDVPGEGPVVGTVAALRREKNLGRLIRAVARLHREGMAVRLLVVGGGEERAALEALARAEGLADVNLFAGPIPDPAAAYRAMDVFALSSDTEQMPFSVLEAMATALPVVATRVGDVAGMVATENAPHLADLDDGALADALRPLLTDATSRARLGAANRAKAERDYDEEAMFATYAALWEGRA
ncbi:glycosyltransferase family 4 protein [Roseomonas sp. CCTCC AB2023176]|uniref:glycosyltransferase family 4 protein n=1 Tax=Roseomonas sp. CCTCC AB2023176 TaxID=3342640 RepID=UPI0035DDE704